MLPRPMRLKRSGEISEIQKLGNRAKDGRVLMVFLARPGDALRGGVVIGSKAVTGSVQRNRYRRHFYRLMQEKFESWGNRPSGGMVVMLLGGAEDTAPEVLTTSFQKCLKKLSLD